MKKITLLIISTLITLSSYAQYRETQEEWRSHEFGFHAGATTGVGLSYRYWPGNAGFQLTLLPIKTTDETYFSLGLTGLYNFHEARLFRFFGYLGNTLTINNRTKYDSLFDSEGEYVESTKYNIGIGPGFAFGKRVRFNIMAGYGLYDIFGDFLVYPTGEIGLYFRM